MKKQQADEQRASKQLAIPNINLNEGLLNSPINIKTKSKSPKGGNDLNTNSKSTVYKLDQEFSLNEQKQMVRNVSDALGQIDIEVKKDVLEKMKH